MREGEWGAGNEGEKGGKSVCASGREGGVCVEKGVEGGD